MSVLVEIAEEVIMGDAMGVKENILKAIEEGISPDRVLRDGLLPGMDVIGRQFREGEVGIPEVLLAARAMNTGTRTLKPFYDLDSTHKRGTVCIGTVQGDIHDIGKNLVKLMLECQGFSVIDLGTDVYPEKFVEAHQQFGCEIICCSALLNTTMNEIKSVVRAFEKSGLRDRVKIMVGGAPLTEQFCQRIGADCYTEDAIEAAHRAADIYDRNSKK